MKKRKALILSVGYGQGHNAAAVALGEACTSAGWTFHCEDPCAAAYPRIFRWTQRFYRFCVRRAPWLWGVIYSGTDVADWHCAVKMPLLRGITAYLRRLLLQESPDVVLCTYPLYAHMLDALSREGLFHGRYAVVVTDARVISRPWLRSAAPLLFVPDAGSAAAVRAKYGLPESVVRACGFPVRSAFAAAKTLEAPTPDSLRIVFGAYRRSHEVQESVKALVQAYPHVRITVLADSRAGKLRRRLRREIESGSVTVLATVDDLAGLFAQSHLYIGKAGAATMFECYAALVPMVVNFALPGQEQGNLELLLEEGAGYYAESPTAVSQVVQALTEKNAAAWRCCRAAMAGAARSGAAARIITEIERRFFL